MPRRTRSTPSRLKFKRPSKKRTKLVPWSAIKKHNRKREASSLEKAVYEMLKNERIPFTREKPIGKLHVDVFLEPNTVVELQGCHWHGCLVCNNSLTTDQQAAIVKDARRQYALRKKGFDVVIIWEHEVDSNPERVQAMLRGIYDGIKAQRQ